MLGLYLHIPFCSAICNYCNFNRGLFDGGLKARYVDALVAEIHGVARPFQGRDAAGLKGPPYVGIERERADTIYFGGGTPSLLEPEEVARVIAACGEAF